MTYIPVEIIITEVDPIVIEVQPEAVSQTAANLAIEAKTAIQTMLVTLQPLIDELNTLLAVGGKLDEIEAVEAKLTELTAIYNKLSVLQALYDDLAEFNALYASLSELLAVHTNLGKITNVEAALASIAAIEAKLTELQAVYAKLAEIETVADNIVALAAIHTELAKLTELHSNLAKLTTVYNNLSAIGEVADSIDNLNQLAASLTNLNTLVASLTPLNALASSLDELNTLHSNLSALLTVEDNLTAINTVNAALAPIITAATNIAAIQTAATNIDAIIAAPTHATTATNAASAAVVTKGQVQDLKGDVQTLKSETNTLKLAAETAKENAATSEANSANSKAKAAKWAEEEEDIAVETGKYSAKHWSEKARKIVEDVGTGLLYYGVEIDTAVSSPTLPRVGNLDLHRTLPVHNNSFACLNNDDGSINYKLNPTNWAEKLTGGASNLDGTDGQVTIFLPGFYWKWDVVGTKNYPKISEFDLPGFAYSPPVYLSAYKASLLRTTLKLSSVKNNTADYRGGGNQSAWDALAQSQLQMPATNISRTNFRTYARNRGAGWEAYFYHAWWKTFMLFTIEYATLNSQAAVNTALDASGFKQGGLGNGVTDVNSNKWNHLYGYYPLIPNGASDSLGSGTGEVTYTLPLEFDVLPPTFVNVYSAATAYTVGQYTSYNNLLYKCILNSTGNLPTNTTYWTQTTLYKGVYDAGITYQSDDYVSSGALLYRCILESTGNAVANTTYFVAVTRSTTKVNRYRGIEMPFGHIWDWCDGVNIRAAANSDADPTHKAYVSDNPADWNDANYTNYTLIGQLPRNDGYIKQMIPNHFLPLVAGGTGAGSSAYWCDSFYQSIPASGVVLRGLLLGGTALYGATAGLGSANTGNVPSTTAATIGSRLCFLPSA